jgi:hypothetical protein
MFKSSNDPGQHLKRMPRRSLYQSSAGAIDRVGWTRFGGARWCKICYWKLVECGYFAATGYLRVKWLVGQCTNESSPFACHPCMPFVCAPLLTMFTLLPVDLYGQWPWFLAYLERENPKALLMISANTLVILEIDHLQITHTDCDCGLFELALYTWWDPTPTNLLHLSSSAELVVVGCKVVILL